MEQEQSKITYVYYDPNFDAKKVGRPRHGFYSKRDDQRAKPKIARELYIEYPDIKHGQEVEFRAPERKVVSNNERLAETPYTRDELRNMAMNTLVDILTTGNDNQKLAAARELLDRIDGKAVQQVNQNVQGQVQQQVIVQVEYVKSRDGREIIDAQPIGGVALPVTGSKSDEGV